MRFRAQIPGLFRTNGQKKLIFICNFWSSPSVVLILLSQRFCMVEPVERVRHGDTTIRFFSFSFTVSP